MKNIELVKENERLVYQAVKDLNISKTSPLYEEAVASGFLGLVAASDGFDESLGYAFSTYAYPTIKRTILTGLNRVNSCGSMSPRTVACCAQYFSEYEEITEENIKEFNSRKSRTYYANKSMLLSSLSNREYLNLSDIVTDSDSNSLTYEDFIKDDKDEYSKSECDETFESILSSYRETHSMTSVREAALAYASSKYYQTGDTLEDVANRHGITRQAANAAYIRFKKWAKKNVRI